jgi:hypothetical protein
MLIAFPAFAGTEYRIAWAPSSGAVLYRVVIEKSSSSGAYKALKDFTTQSTSLDVSLDPGSYRYQVSAQDAFGLWSDPSAWLDFTVSSPPAPKPPASAPSKPPVPVAGGTRASFSLGADGEANMITSGSGFGYGGGLIGECRFNKLFALGTWLQSTWSSDSVAAIEGVFFARWYFLRFKHISFSLDPYFGALAAIKGGDSSDSRGSADLGMVLSMRFVFNRFYIEPYIRGGYPVLGGAGIRIGWTNND